MKQLVYRGESASTFELGKLLDSGSGVERILLVTGNRSYTASGAEDLLERTLADREILKFEHLPENPEAEILSALLKRAAEFDPTVIIAVGGGSIIDYAKLLKAFVRDSGNFDPGCLQTVPSNPAEIPLLAVPTTAGSGSEATHFAVIYSNGAKFSVGSPKLLPDVCFLVPDLLDAAPAKQRAASALDALCQSIESYWSIHSTDASRSDAMAALKLCVAALGDPTGFLNNRFSRNLQEGAYLAGRAINATKTTAPHSVSYALTSHFGVTHGFAVALLLPEFLIFNAGLSDADTLDMRGGSFALKAIQDIVAALDCEDSVQAAALLRNIVRGVGGPTRLTDVAISSSENIETILRDGFNPQRVNNNPRKLTRRDLACILEVLR